MQAVDIPRKWVEPVKPVHRPTQFKHGLTSPHKVYAIPHSPQFPTLAPSKVDLYQLGQTVTSLVNSIRTTNVALRRRQIIIGLDSVGVHVRITYKDSDRLDNRLSRFLWKSEQLEQFAQHLREIK